MSTKQNKDSSEKFAHFNVSGLNKSADRAISLEELEIDLLCEAIYRFYGFDFRQYARASLKRRILNLVDLEQLSSISALLEKVLHDRNVMERFLLNLSINVTSMFRDPQVYLAIRQKVIPLLSTYPSLRVWHAGCSSGEEVYSMNVVLTEECPDIKTTIYATDFNEAIIKQAKSAIMPINKMREYTSNYQKSGGQQAFSEYYTAKYDSVVMRDKLRDNIVFSRHNLATDSSFNEFNVIFCRNVMIYFNEALRDRVLTLLHHSLCRFGILVLGTKESLRFTPLEDKYQELDAANRIYQRID